MVGMLCRGNVDSVCYRWMHLYREGMCNEYIVVLCFTFLLAFFYYAFTGRKYCLSWYNEGVHYLEENNCTKAVECFENIPNYRNYKDISVLLDQHASEE